MFIVGAIVGIQRVFLFDDSRGHQDNSCIFQESPVATRVIPNYALYGDQAMPSWHNSFDFEWIPQRSRPYNWKIRPHKHDAFIQILLLTAGSGEVSMDNAKVMVTAPCLILIPAQTVHGFLFSQDVDGPVVTAAQRPLESLMGVVMPELLPLVRKPAIFDLSPSANVGQTDTALSALMPLFLAIERESKLFAVGKTSATIALLAAVCVQVARLDDGVKATHAPSNGRVGSNASVSAVTSAQSRASSRKTMQIEKFRALVNDDYKKHKPITAYAEQLGITSGQLSRLCREVLGVSSLDVINARLIHEAQRDLIYTVSTIKQLADALGFADETYFGRFFRKHTGLSPREFQAKASHSLV
jgi:AraC family transcriptional activator of pobA